MKSLFSLSTSQTEKNSWKIWRKQIETSKQSKLGKTRLVVWWFGGLVVWWFDVMNKIFLMDLVDF
jgi:hypothetical protein